jgi:DNA primase
MNCQLANKIDLVLYLEKQGHKPTKKTKTSVWFLSPFRTEKTASFKVDLDKNIWRDFGEGTKGTVIDLVIKLNCCSVKTALEILNTNNFSFLKQKEKREIASEPKYSILKVAELSNLNLVNYINSRKIDIELAKRFLYQVHYSFQSKKQYYGIGFMNDKGGFEIRSKYFKGCLGKKAITSINNNQNSTSIFESWSDFLSYLTLKKEIPNENFIVLNSTSLVKCAIELLDNTMKIKCFLDNDEAGNKAFNYLKKTLNKEIIDQRIHYKKKKDLNEFLIINNSAGLNQ